MSVLLIVFSFQIFYSFASSDKEAVVFFSGMRKPIFILRQASLLIGPLIYLYFCSFLKKKKINTYWNLLHLIPFTLVLIFLIFFYSNLDKLNDEEIIIWAKAIHLSDTILILSHSFIYFTLSLLMLRSVNISFKDFYKSIRKSSYNTWLQFILLGFIVFWIINLNSFAIYMIIENPWWCAFSASIYGLLAFLFVNAIMFTLLLKPDIYNKITKYKNNKLNAGDKKEYLIKLNEYMEKEKPYLNPELSLESLANDISANPRILSQIINETYNKTFKGYILEFRIRESMKILEDPKYSRLTVLEILYKVGFNSKSSFNNQFKLYTNLTPLEYRSKFHN